MPLSAAAHIAHDGHLRDLLRTPAAGTPGWTGQAPSFGGREDRRCRELAAKVAAGDPAAYEQAAETLLGLPGDVFSADTRSLRASQPGTLALLHAFCARMVDLAAGDEQWLCDQASLQQALGLSALRKLDSDAVHDSAVQIVSQLACSPVAHTAASMIRHAHEAMIRACLDQLVPLTAEQAMLAQEGVIMHALGRDRYRILTRRRLRAPRTLAHLIDLTGWERIIRAALTDTETGPATPAASLRHLVEVAVAFGLARPAAFGEL